MNCTACTPHSCRTLKACPALLADSGQAMKDYREKETQDVVRCASHLVDGGLAGSLSRMEELVRFIKDRGYGKAGLAYCYGLEREAKRTVEFFKKRQVQLSAVSCTAGGLAQSQVNSESPLGGVSCNPLTQAAQLEAEGVDFAIQFGLCLGHDILFSKAFKGDQSVLVVKDRLYGHNPLLALEEGKI